MLFPFLFQALTSKSPVPTKGPPSLGREPACHRLLCSRHHDAGQSGSSKANGCSSGSGRSGHLHQEAGGQPERSRPGGQSLGRCHGSCLILPHTESRAPGPWPVLSLDPTDSLNRRVLEVGSPESPWPQSSCQGPPYRPPQL